MEDDAEEDDAEELEVLFGRITSGGTPITTAELNYSAIKVYWPNVRVICDKVSEKCMPAHFLALMVFRLYILESSKGKWQTDVSISTIRKLRENKESITDVELLFKRVEKLVDCVDSWLLNHNNGVPKVIRSDIAINHPDLYLFLLWLADKYPDKFESEYITALTCFIKWFSKEPIETIKHLYSSLQGTDFSKEVVLSILYDIKASSENIIWPCSLTEYDNLKLLMYSSFSPHWNSSQHIQDVAYETWAKVRTNPWDFPDMLIYAQRDYFNTNFSKYDASNKKLWDSHNRPWDYDHIMPKDWIYKQRNGEWREFDNIWLNDVGNLAAIPFELNRSKGNESDWKYYEENQDELMYEDTSSISTNIRFRESESKKFALNTLVRTGRIYAKVFALINEVISDNIDISHTSCYINYRKKFLESLSQKCKSIGFNTSITIPNISGLEQVISNSSKRSDWASKEIFLNIDCINQEYVVSLSLNASKRNSITMGIRISPNHLVLEQSVFESLRHLNSTSEYYENSNRWYLYRSVSINDSEEHIHEEIEKIIKLFEPAFLAQIKTLPIENNNA